MSTHSPIRRIATAAAYGGGGLGALGAVAVGTFYGVVLGEARLARRRIPVAGDADFPNVHGTVWAADGVDLSRAPIHLAVLGDSTAAGYGVQRDRDTPGGQLAIGISAAAGRPVRLSAVATVGARSSMLEGQLAQLPDPPALAVMIIGANDVTHRVKPAESVRVLREAVVALRGLGAEVVVATCPDLGTIRPIAQPLRYVARRLSRRLAAAQTVAVIEAGGRTVSLADLLGPMFANRLELFSEDRFHPSAAGYAAAAAAILPSCVDALGLRTWENSAGPFTSKRARPIVRAAAQAASRPGIEVVGAAVKGETRGPRGRWATLRRRRTQRSVAAETARAVGSPP